VLRVLDATMAAGIFTGRQPERRRSPTGRDANRFVRGSGAVTADRPAGFAGEAIVTRRIGDGVWNQAPTAHCIAMRHLPFTVSFTIRVTQKMWAGFTPGAYMLSVVEDAPAA
jgi:hypothetical protein